MNRNSIILSAKHVTHAKLFIVAVLVSVSVIIYLFSILAARRIFAASELIPYATLQWSIFALAEMFFVLFMMTFVQIGEFWDRKSGKKIPEAEPVIPIQVQAADPELYVKRAEEVRVETEADRQQKRAEIMNYVHYVVPTILKEEDIPVFCLEIEGWLDDSGYSPVGRNWKWREDAKFKVKHLDLRHLVWNIAIRMGMSDGYNTIVCACFLKKMFPDLCKDVKDTTLSQCLTADANKGNIVLDKPEANSYAFHYDKDEEE